MKIDEIKELSNKEILGRVRELKEEIFQMRLRKASGQLEKPHLFSVYRREIARCLTFLSQRENLLP